ncbi:MAG: ArsS family sensor histidine kinase [Sulfurovaceae bacterium]|nr:ArsS family sensor histidine kinase [Sulfurovaceae bacterium]
MKNLSVTTFLHLLFSLTITIVVATLFIFWSWNTEKHKLNEMYHYKLIADAFLSNIQLDLTPKELDRLYKDFSVKSVNLETAKLDIEKHGKTIFGGQSLLGSVRIFETPTAHYIYVQRLGHNLMLQDDRPKNYTLEIGLGVGMLLISVLLLLYIAILRKLKPLKKLNKEIQAFAKGNMQKRISYKSNDEIGKIAKSFDDAILHINHLSASKNLFMRNIMHELKTPITKGRIIIESIDDIEVKNVLVRAFERMNELIEELATVERVTTQGFVPHLEMTSISDVISKSQELLMSDKNCEIINTGDRAILTDIKLLSLAIKNLLDNGIKYSPNKKVLLKTTNNSIEIISQGEMLKHPLSFYTEPFSQEEKRNSGFGLGLYIVKNILDKLHLGFKYRYDNNNNIFIIKIQNSNHKTIS